MIDITETSIYDTTITFIEKCLLNQNFPEALTACNQALKYFPDNFRLYYYLAFIAFTAGNADDTKKYSIQAFELININDIPEYELTYINSLGIILRTHKYFALAKKCFSILLEKQPSNSDHFDNMAITYRESHNYDKALEWFIKTAQISPNYNAFNNIGDILFQKREVDEALEYFIKARDLMPEKWEPYHNIGTALQHKGLKEDAAKNFKKAIEIFPHNHLAYNGLVSVTKFQKGDASNKIIDEISAILAKPDLTNKDIYFFNSCLGQIFNDLKEYDKAFLYYKKANDAQSKEFNFNITKLQNHLNRHKAIFTQDTIKKRKSYGNLSKLPIFIVGMPRSGTSLTEQIISSHSLVSSAGETAYIEEVINQVQPRHVPEHFSPFTAFPEVMPYLSKQDIHTIADNYLTKIKRGIKGTFKIIDKMPDNVFNVGFINFIFPNATIIHCKRHPLDILISIYLSIFEEVEFANNLDYIVQQYKCYDNIIKYWHSQFPNKIYDIYYEELVYKQEEKSRELIKICGLKWEDACLNFHQNERATFTASKLQVKEPMYSSSIFRFKNYQKYLDKAKEDLKDEIAEYEAEIIKRVPGLLKNL